MVPGGVFAVHTASLATSATTPLAVSGRWLCYLADEGAHGAGDLNGDGDALDQVAVAVNIESAQEFPLAVAAGEVAWLGEELYLVVDELLDGRDWGGSGAAVDLVLLHWAPGEALTAVDALEREGERHVLALENVVLYVSAEAPPGPFASNLRALAADAPTLPREVPTVDADGGLSPRLLGADEGLVFLALDETAEGRELNGDGDASDRFVLALLDGRGSAVPAGYDRPLRSTGLALRDGATPLRAKRTGSADWRVALLVDEASQGANLNVFDGSVLPSSWQVPGCPDDTDTTDQVLFTLDFAAWDADPLAAPPENTGIAGADRVLVAGPAVAALSPEADEANCWLNGDADAADRVLRWFIPGAGPIADSDLLLAVDEVPGPARGVAELQGRFVVAVDEAADDRDHDGDREHDRSLLAWLDPAALPPTWVFDHDPHPAGVAWASATWMAEAPGHGRLGVGYAESSNGVDLNRDGDAADSMPSFAAFVETPSVELRFPGFVAATLPDRVGIRYVSGWAFYRVDEAAGADDWNGNGVTDDVLLFGTRLAGGFTTRLGAVNRLERPAVEGEPDGGGANAAFLVQESLAGDLNGDGDAFDFLVRYFSL